MAFTIGKLEKTSPHLLADLVELVVALDLDGRSEYQLEDIASVIEGQPDFDEEDPRTLRECIADAWIQLGYRVGRFDGNYPFRLIHGALRIKPTLTNGARIYRLLLSCSRLRSFDHRTRGSWAAIFTQLSREAMCELMPPKAAVRIFDANSVDRRQYFGTDLRKALKVLGKDLAATHISDAECVAMSSSGDAGVDLVAIATWGDQAAGIHAILGQCAAREKDWPEKRLQASPLALRALFTFLSDPVNAVFIPVLYRDATGAWVMQTPASGCVLVDRLRVLLLLRDRKKQNQIVATTWFKKFEREFYAKKKTVMASAA